MSAIAVRPDMPVRSPAECAELLREAIAGFAASGALLPLHYRVVHEADLPEHVDVIAGFDQLGQLYRLDGLGRMQGHRASATALQAQIEDIVAVALAGQPAGWPHVHVTLRVWQATSEQTISSEG